MVDVIDIISPRTIGEDKIVITVDPVSKPLLAGNPITVNFDYTAATPGGVVLPLELIVQPGFGRGEGYFTQIFRNSKPNSFAFTLPSAGRWLVTLRECAHNYWQGRIKLDVGGEEFTQILSERQEPG